LTNTTNSPALTLRVTFSPATNDLRLVLPYRTATASRAITVSTIVSRTSLRGTGEPRGCLGVASTSTSTPVMLRRSARRPYDAVTGQAGPFGATDGPNQPSLPGAVRPLPLVGRTGFTDPAVPPVPLGSHPRTRS